MSKLYHVEHDAFDPDAFKKRYGLKDTDFKFGFAGATDFVVVLANGVVLPDDPPIFEAPPPLKTPADHMEEFIGRLVPNVSTGQRRELATMLRKATGALPPDRDVPASPAEERKWKTVPPIHVRGGTATTAPFQIEPGVLMTHPQPGDLEYIDDGVAGHLYFTVNVEGVPQRFQIL